MPADLKALTRRWFEEVWNLQKDQAIEQLLSPGALIHGLSEDLGHLTGPVQFRKFYEPFRAAFLNLKVTVEDVLQDGDKTVARVSMTAKHTGDSLGIPATGKVVRTTGIIIIRWLNDRIAEGWNEFDAAGLQKQLASAQPAKFLA